MELVLTFCQFNYFNAFGGGGFAEFVGFAFAFVVGDYEVRIFNDITVAIYDA